MTADPELGLFYVATETPTNDYYGGYRPGDNLFGNSVLALEAETGERVWHFQLTHHELWDYDIPTAPILVDIEVDGVPIKALVQLSKQGFAYVLNRETGEPVGRSRSGPSRNRTFRASGRLLHSPTGRRGDGAGVRTQSQSRRKARTRD